MLAMASALSVASACTRDCHFTGINTFAVQPSKMNDPWQKKEQRYNPNGTKSLN